jgi:hypothetical protein
MARDDDSRLVARARRQKLVDDAAAHLIRVLRHLVERGLSRTQLASTALVQISRPEQPGAQLSGVARERMREALSKLAASLDEPLRYAQLERFARETALLTVSLLKQPRHPGVTLRDRIDEPRDLAEAALWAERRFARSQEDLLHRAVTRAIRERKRGRRGKHRLPISEGDPLRGLLDLPQEGKVILARHDLRTLLLRAAPTREQGEVGLVPLLRRAARFGDDVLRPALGEDLWALCRPVGFADKNEAKLLVEVRASVFAQEVSLRKAELLHRIQRVRGFESVNDVRFVIDEDARLVRRRAQPRGSAPSASSPAIDDVPAGRVQDVALQRTLDRWTKR